MVFNNVGPSLSLLKHILLDNVNKKVCFITRKIDILYNDYHLQAFCVDPNEKNYLTIPMVDVHGGSSVVHLCNGNYYVVNTWWIVKAFRKKCEN